MGIRKKSLTLEEKNTILTRWIQGRSRGAIAREINRDVSTVSRYLKRVGVPSNAHNARPDSPEGPLKISVIPIKLSKSEKTFKYEQIYSVLKEICNIDGYVFVSDSYIASLAGVSNCSATQSIHYLQRNGYIAIEKRIVKDLGYVRVITVLDAVEKKAS